MADTDSQMGKIPSTTSEGSKSPGLDPPYVGDLDPAIRGTAPVDPVQGTPMHTQTIYLSGGTTPIGPGLTTSMGTWPVRPKSKTDERI